MKNSKKSNILPNVLLPSSPLFPDAARFPGSALFLDIETTGLSGSRNRLYLIGTASVQNGRLTIEQYFAESPKEEPALVAAFDKLIEPFDTIITFHGNHFDLPFLGKCRKRLGMDSPVSNNKHYVDLYNIAHSYRHLFGLENYRLKTLESYFGIHRKDALDGKEMIQTYQAYVKQPQEHLLALMLQHNEDDLAGMAQLLSIYAYERFFQGSFDVCETAVSSYRKLDGTKGEELIVSLRLNIPLPAAVSCKNSRYYLHAENHCARLCIPLFTGTLKYFYPNYKDYYYFPKEDAAIHKSVACYADPKHREKAKAATCYSKKAGLFLPQYEEVITPAFYTEYRAPVSYFEWKDASLCQEALTRYCMHILHILKAGKE
ncbi:MAG: ribonuclease H-like domain-containing protein [Eubacterium sp.]|nr:ribonuclease H-like domain-containing protein [Eubacterium sp.]